MILHKILLTVTIYCDIVFMGGDTVIGKTLQRILKEKGMNPNELAKRINVSNQTLYSIIKRDNMKIDFEVLLKICNALDVSVECFYEDYVKEKSDNAPEKIEVVLNEHQQKVINAYIAHPEMQAAVDKLLGVDTEEAVTIKSDIEKTVEGAAEILNKNTVQK